MLDIESLSVSRLAAVSGGFLVAYAVLSVVLEYFSPKSRWLRTQEWVGTQDGWFPKYRTRIRSLLGSRRMLMDTYGKLQDQFFVLPLYGGEPLLLLPPSKLKDLLQKSDDEVNSLIPLKEASAAKWTDDEITVDPFHMDVVRHQLTRKLPLMTSDVYAELVLGFEDQWRTNGDEWIKISAWKSSSNVITRAANRVFSGADLCREEELLKHTQIYARGIFETGGIVNVLPKWLQPVLGPIIASRLRKHVAICKRIAMPVVQQRLEETQSGVKGEVHQDALQWVIEECIKRNDPAELDPDRITRRLLRLNVVAIHTTSITTVNTLLDLYSSPRADEFVAGLREECERVLKAHGGQWNKGAVNDLVRIDSTIKESMRLHAIFTAGVVREVTKEGGVDLGDGMNIPHGVRIASPNAAIHRDQRYYNSPYEFDAFRFARSRESMQTLDKRNQGLVTTSESFLAFGHGRHACPGRFFAAQEMKLFLAYVVMHFDVKLPGPRPKNFDFKNACGPPPRAQLLIRTRKS